MTDNEATPPGDEADDLVTRLQGYDSLLDAHWSAWTQEARDNFGFVAGDQWDDETREQMAATNRVAITFNRTEPTIDAVSGAEVMNRQEVSYQPRQTDDSGIAELETGAAKWVRDECDAEHEESESFRDMLICGMGWTETRRDPEEQPDSQLVIERVDPTQMAVDPASTKRNCADARFLRRKKAMSRREFEDTWPDDDPDGPAGPGKRVTIVDPESRYHNGPLQDSKDEVYVSEYQWFEMDLAHVRVETPDGTVRVDPQEYAAADPTGAFGGQHVPKRRVYYRAFMAGGRMLPFPDGNEIEPLMFGPDERGSFTYKCMTGKRDRNNGTWYGLVRPMKDPQRFANKFFSQINHILAVNAKGGVMAERGAVDDVREFEETFASSEQITYVGDGALSNGKIIPKPQVNYPTGLDRLMEFSTQSIRDVTGVNLETLGLAEREQAGVLEQQRKQQTYGLLSTYFDSKRLYNKEQGRLLLSMMQEFIEPGTLVRLDGQNGLAQYVPFVRQPSTTTYDIIVDDAPAGPNQKRITNQLLLQLVQIVGPENVPAEVWPEIVKTMDLPQGVVQTILNALQSRAAAPPSPEQQMDLEERGAKVADTQAKTKKTLADASKTVTETALLPQDKAVEHTTAMEASHRETQAQITARLEAIERVLSSQQPDASQIY